MNNANASSNSWAANNKSNPIRLAFWTFTWVASMAVAAFGPRLLWDYATVPTVIGILVNLAFGFGMIMANWRYLRGLDELHRKIFLDASALTLGVGLVCGLAYEQLEERVNAFLNLPLGEMEMPDLVKELRRIGKTAR